MLRETIVAAIDDYLAASGMSPSGFGMAVVRDGKFLRNLREGRVTFRNVEKALTFISDHPPRPSAFAGQGAVARGRGAALSSGHPLVRAAIVLGGRLEREGGHYRLDGRLAATADVVRAANEKLRAAGQPLIAYPGIALPDLVRR